MYIEATGYAFHYPGHQAFVITHRAGDLVVPRPASDELNDLALDGIAEILHDDSRRARGRRKAGKHVYRFDKLRRRYGGGKDSSRSQSHCLSRLLLRKVARP